MPELVSRSAPVQTGCAVGPLGTELFDEISNVVSINDLLATKWNETKQTDSRLRLAEIHLTGIAQAMLIRCRGADNGNSPQRVERPKSRTLFGAEPPTPTARERVPLFEQRRRSWPTKGKRSLTEGGW